MPFTPVASMERSLGDGQPNFTGTLAKHPSVRAGAATPGRDTPPLNERGASLQAAFDAVDDPSFTECAPHGLIRQASSVHAARITQHEDRVVFEYEEGAARRVAWLDGQGPEAAGNVQGSGTAGSTGLGHSVARYVDDTLVVESNRLLSDLTGTEGNVVSERHTVVETYRRVDDEIGPALDLVLVVHDPDYVAGYKFTESDCRLPFFAN